MKREIMVSKRTKRVITYGTFDMFHIGHLKLLQRAKALGDELIVAVSTDAFNEKKGKKTLISFEQRAEIVANIKCVDKVIAEESWEQKQQDIETYSIDLLVMGNDWEGKFDMLKGLCDVVYLERTDNISSSQLKKSLINFASISREDIIRAFEVIEILKKDFE